MFNFFGFESSSTKDKNNTKNSPRIEKELIGSVHLTIVAGKHFKPSHTKYYIAYDSVANISDRIESSSKLTRMMDQTKARTAEKRAENTGIIRWGHTSSVNLYEGDIAIKFECYSNKQWRNPLGEIVIETKSLQSGVSQKRWIKLKAVGDKRKKKQLILISIKYLDVFSKKFVAMFSDKDKEDEAVKFYKEHIDSIPAEIQISSKGESSALQKACKNNWVELTKLLLENGANPNKTNKRGILPIMFACKNSSEEIFDALLPYCEDFEITDNDSLGLLQYACRGDSIKIVSTLISKGCKIAFTPGVPSPLHFAAETGNVEILKKVLDTGIYIDPVSKFDDTTPLTIAVKNGNYDSVKLLLENGANANHVSAYMVPCVIAANNNFVEILQLLLEPKYHVNISRYHSTMVHAATEKGFIEILKVLIPIDRKVLDVIYSGQTCVHTAVVSKKLACLEYLLKEHANPNIIRENWKDMQQVTPLAMSTKMGNPEFVFTLLKYGENINVNIPCSWQLYECSNLTPLHITVLVQDFESLKLLMKISSIGISLSTRTKSLNRVWNNMTPEDLAYRSGLTGYLTELQGGAPSVTKTLINPIAKSFLHAVTPSISPVLRIDNESEKAREESRESLKSSGTRLKIRSSIRKHRRTKSTQL